MLIPCMFCLILLCFASSCTTSKYGCYDFTTTVSKHNENRPQC